MASPERIFRTLAVAKFKCSWVGGKYIHSCVHQLTDLKYARKL